MEVPKDWYEELKDELSLPYIQDLKNFIQNERKSGSIIYPPEELIFSAFFHTPFQEVKVVIVGQDPYHGENQANGLSFSVQKGLKLPPSLKNIFKEISTDLQVPLMTEGCLLSWAKQGVLLLNATLTVRAKEPKSHHNKGWEKFTDYVIKKLLKRENPIIFLLWGKSAQEKGKLILESPKHKSLISSHPSPYSVKGFYGCRHFSKTNNFLINNGEKPINWYI